jgi:hypothetical protein
VTFAPDGGGSSRAPAPAPADGDAGCSAGENILDAYVELELAGEDPLLVYPGTAIHFESRPGCRADHAGLLAAARRFADVTPD